MTLDHYTELLSPIHAFLHCPTPDAWVAAAVQHTPLLLQDHAHCELKAALTAHSLIRRYCLPREQRQRLPALSFYDGLEAVPDKDEVLGRKLTTDDERRVFDLLTPGPLLGKLVRLIQEELHHYAQVREIMAARGIGEQPLSAGRYAKGLLAAVRTHEPACLVDRLIVGAYIEARSCERFACLVPLVDEELGRFYLSLLRSEARHYQDYLSLAQSLSPTSIGSRVALFGALEAELISTPDLQLRFHSGLPVAA
ncbi:MAG: tRNA isopentenyl-2-thiomethyl-A-37 hydroxylase MiaE [Aeromonadaceae bacterium]|nr:tRNA isopentenyl-2-thiomethyl-A-37 hydroxylase MiaE [Aeromonadaceae bacterium]